MKRIRDWMYRNARPVDLARYRWHFEGGTREDVLSALRAYQNPDGGFAHALEADFWSPASSPMQTWCATQKLWELGEFDKNAPMARGIARYLHETFDFQKRRWPATMPANNAHPHAPWWTHGENEEAEWGDNPTAPLAAYLLRLDPNDEIAQSAARAAIKRYLADARPLGSDSLNGIYRLIQVFPENEALKDKYTRDILCAVDADEARWTTYACRPSMVIEGPENPAAKALAPVIQKELAYLARARNGDGVWNITWAWQAYPREFAISETWWKGQLAVNHLLFLRAFSGKMPD